MPLVITCLTVVLCKLPVHHRWGLSWSIADSNIFSVRTAFAGRIEKYTPISWLKIELECSHSAGEMQLPQCHQTSVCSVEKRALVRLLCSEGALGRASGATALQSSSGSSAAAGDWSLSVVTEGFFASWNHPIKWHVGGVFIHLMMIVKPPVVGILVRKLEWPRGLWLNTLARACGVVLDQEIRVGLPALPWILWMALS